MYTRPKLSRVTTGLDPAKMRAQAVLISMQCFEVLSFSLWLFNPIFAIALVIVVGFNVN